MKLNENENENERVDERRYDLMSHIFKEKRKVAHEDMTFTKIWTKIGTWFFLVELQLPSAFQRYITLTSTAQCSKVINVYIDQKVPKIAKKGKMNEFGFFLPREKTS